jgi:MYXO-CTERM domain-containing protein
LSAIAIVMAGDYKSTSITMATYTIGPSASSGGGAIGLGVLAMLGGLALLRRRRR